MTDRPRTNNKFTKLSDQLADDLNMGLITLEEYGLLVYMLQRADKNTGILITNSGSLVRHVNKDRAWVHNRLTALRKKNLIHSATSGKPELNQRRGSRNPYPIGFRDHIPIGEKTSRKPVANQSQTSRKPDSLTSQNQQESSEATEPLTESDIGTVLAPEDLDKDLDKDYYSNEEEKIASLIESFQKADVQFRIVNDVQRQMLVELLDYPQSQIQDVLQRAAEKGVQGSNLITWAQKGLENYDRLYNAGAQGLFDSKRDRVERELEEMKRELEEIIQVGNPKNEPWIKQQRERIQHRTQLLKVMENPRPNDHEEIPT